MLGVLCGLGSAMAFGANAIITRRGMMRVSSNYIATLSIFFGSLFFLVVNVITGDLLGIGGFHWKAYLYWALSGVIHFALGRTWAYRSIQLLGSNRSNVVTSLNPVVTIVLAVIILKEEITPTMALGILFVLGGPLLIILLEPTVSGSQRVSRTYGKEIDRRTLLLGMFYGIGAAVFWGSSAIFIKFGLKTEGSPVAGSLIAYVAGSIVVTPSLLLNKEQRQEVFNEGWKSLRVAIFSSLTSSTAQLLRYLSLGYGAVIVVTLAGRTTPLWVLLLSFLFNRKYESFSQWVLLGNGLLVIGSILVIFH